MNSALRRCPCEPSTSGSRCAPGSRQLQTAGDRVRCAAAAKGRALLVGAGPGPAEHLTLKAARVIGEADVIIYDDLGAQDALQLAKPSCNKVYVGKRGGKAGSAKQQDIDRLLVDACLKGQTVVRLKGGDPAVFSRVASEMAALAAAGVPYEFVPGVSSALAAPLAGGFPLTDVSLSPSFAVVSGHDVEGTDWAAFARVPTLVVLMGGRALGTICLKLQQQAGWGADTPVAVVRSAWLPDQRVWRTTLGGAAEGTAGEDLSPCVVVFGRVAALPDTLALAAAAGDEQE